MSQNIILIGPAQSGKTFLINQLTRSYFEPFRTDSAYIPTIGIDIVGTNTKDNIKYIRNIYNQHDKILWRYPGTWCVVQVLCVCNTHTDISWSKLAHYIIHPGLYDH